jgi:hypothetical protein
MMVYVYLLIQKLAEKRIGKDGIKNELLSTMAYASHKE